MRRGGLSPLCLSATPLVQVSASAAFFLSPSRFLQDFLASGPAVALGRSASPPPCPPALASRGQSAPLRRGPAAGRRRGEGGRQRRGEKLHWCTSFTPQGLPRHREPPTPYLRPSRPGATAFLLPMAPPSGAPPLRSLVAAYSSRCFTLLPLLCGSARTSGTVDDPRTGRTPQGLDLPVGSALQDHFAKSESELLS
ncbi:hypothetical protein NDU88_002993 [Pleurodeles waltl]|uniref:Uncharacterized protein n=1 Tax=Pleurodeles waltl TaxID=8319 RepID=A0AAV7QDH5_PLEWA|nr:hypothetical protein NDU88_002993 [Pleurodeles waltl]